MTSRQKDARKSGKNLTSVGRAELVGAVACACLYAAIVIYLVVLAMFSGPNSTRFEITVSEPRRDQSALYFEFEVVNLGTRSVADVHVGSSRHHRVATEVVFDYVPAGSKRRGTIVYPANASPLDPAIAVISYRDP